jgi:hypothetical protein
VTGIPMCDRTGISYHQNGQGMTEDYSKAIWFTPDAIRDHYDGTEDNPTIGMTDEELKIVGRTALQDEYLWDVYSEVLGDTITRFTSGKKQVEREDTTT